MSIEKCQKMDELLKHPGSYCNQHSEKRVEIYCLECKCALCTSCFVLNHSGHKCADINKAADELKAQIRTDVEITNEIEHKINIDIQHIEKLMETLNEDGNASEKKILRKVEEMKRTIDKHVHDLFQKLVFEKSVKIKDLEMTKEELLIRKLNCESFKTYAEKVLGKAAATDVARVASDLNKMANDIKNTSDIYVTKQIGVSFVPSDFVVSLLTTRIETSSDDHDINEMQPIEGNIIGTIHIEEFEIGMCPLFEFEFVQ